jgi:hypothetical protein
VSVLHVRLYDHLTNPVIRLYICDALRIVFIFAIYYDTYDMTWESYPTLILLAIETHVGVMCASAPALEAYFKGWNSSPEISSHEPEKDFISVVNTIEVLSETMRVSRTGDRQLRQSEFESSEQLRRSPSHAVEEGYGSRSESPEDIIELGHLVGDSQYREPQFPHIGLAADIFSRPSEEE